MEKVRYEEMLPHEIVARRQKFAAAFLGLGGLEWHGEHLAIGNDALKAEKLCELAAAQSGGFVFPTLWYGEPRITGIMESDHDGEDMIRSKMEFTESKFSEFHFGSSAEEQIKFYQQLLNHLLLEMNQLEMKAICLLSGHYPIYDWALPVVEQFNARFNDSRAFVGTEFHYALALSNMQFGDNFRDQVNEGIQIGVGGDHAAKWETSYLWYLRPDCVDMSIYLGREEEPLIGVWGTDPRKEASIEIGRNACNIIVQGMVHMAKTLLGM